MLRKIFASLFVVIFSVFFSVAFIIFVLLNTLLDTSYYHGDVSTNLRDGYAELFTSLLYTNSEVTNPSNFLTTPSREKLVEQIKENISSEDVEKIMTSFIYQITHQAFDKDGNAWMSVDLSVFEKVPALKPFIADTEVKFHSEKGEPNSYLSIELLWDVFKILCAICALFLVVIGLIIHRPWYRVLRWVSKAIWIPAITLAAVFYALSTAPTYLVKWGDMDIQGAGNNFGAYKAIMEAVITPFAKYAYVLSLWIFFIALAFYIVGVVVAILKNRNERITKSS